MMELYTGAMGDWGKDRGVNPRWNPGMGWLSWTVNVQKTKGEGNQSFPMRGLNLSKDIYRKLARLIFTLQREVNMFSESQSH